MTARRRQVSRPRQGRGSSFSTRVASALVPGTARRGKRREEGGGDERRVRSRKSARTRARTRGPPPAAPGPARHGRLAARGSAPSGNLRRVTVCTRCALYSAFPFLISHVGVAWLITAVPRSKLAAEREPHPSPRTCRISMGYPGGERVLRAAGDDGCCPVPPAPALVAGAAGASQPPRRPSVVEVAGGGVPGGAPEGLAQLRRARRVRSANELRYTESLRAIRILLGLLRPPIVRPAKQRGSLTALLNPTFRGSLPSSFSDSARSRSTEPSCKRRNQACSILEIRDCKQFSRVLAQPNSLD